MKKLIATLFIVLSTLTFSACSSDEESSSSNTLSIEANQTAFENSEIGIGYPMDWEALERDDFTSGVPVSTIVAFRSNIKNEKFTSNISINKKDFEEETTAIDFAKSTIEQAKNSLLNFTEIDSRETNGGYLLTFQGKGQPSDPLLTFKQFYITKGKTGYTVTAAYLSDTDEATVKMIDSSVNTFILK